MARSVRLLLNVKVEGKWKLLPIAQRNGRPRWGYVVLGGREEHHPEGRYYIDYYTVEGQRQRAAVGSTPAAAREALHRKEAELAAIDAGVLVATPATTAVPIKTLLDGAVERYLRDREVTERAKATLAQYRRVLTQFQNSCPKRFVEDVTRDDVLDFMAELKGRGDCAVTVRNRAVIVMSFLRSCGVEKLLARTDWPRTMSADVQVYSRSELQQFFAACDMDEFDLFWFLLTTGFRDAEAQVAEWSDVDFENGTIHICEKPRWHFKPKGRQARTVPVPDSLLRRLAARRKRMGDSSRLIFPSVKGKPDQAFWRPCKGVAYRAGLNCGQCETAAGRCAEGPYCSRWHIHGFRDTFATWHLRSGVDVRTVQAWLGHKSLLTTSKYLAVATGPEARAKINKGVFGCELPPPAQ